MTSLRKYAILVAAGASLPLAAVRESAKVRADAPRVSDRAAEKRSGGSSPLEKGGGANVDVYIF